MDSEGFAGLDTLVAGPTPESVRDKPSEDTGRDRDWRVDALLLLWQECGAQWHANMPVANGLRVGPRPKTA